MLSYFAYVGISILVYIVLIIIIILLVYLLFRKRQKKVNEHINSVIETEKIIKIIDNKSKKEKEELRGKIENSHSLDDLKSIFIEL
jgi:uncharacterized membrane protein